MQIENRWKTTNENEHKEMKERNINKVHKEMQNNQEMQSDN